MFATMMPRLQELWECVKAAPVSPLAMLAYVLSWCLAGYATFMLFRAGGAHSADAHGKPQGSWGKRCAACFVGLLAALLGAYPYTHAIDWGKGEARGEILVESDLQQGTVYEVLSVSAEPLTADIAYRGTSLYALAYERRGVAVRHAFALPPNPALLVGKKVVVVDVATSNHVRRCYYEYKE
jgi:hypothetical protein